MKTKLKYTLISLFLATHLAAAATASNTEVWIFDPSSLANEFDATVDQAADYAYSLDTLPGTRFVAAVATSTGFLTLVDFTVDHLDYDSPTARKLRYGSKFKQVRDWQRKNANNGSFGLLMKSVLEYLVSRGLTVNISLHLNGSPCAKLTQPALDLSVEYPGDGTLASDARHNPVGMSHLQGKFSATTVAWFITDKFDLPSESARRLFRYESLAAAWSGAKIIAYGSDLNSTIAASRIVDQKAMEEFTITNEAPMIHRYFIRELSRSGLPPTMSTALQALRNSGVTRAIAGCWQTSSDVDLWIATRDFPTEGEVSYQHPTGPHLKLLGDKTNATGADFEIVTVDPQVDIRSLDINLNLFVAKESTRGSLVLMDGDDLYEIPFSFDPNCRGSHAADHDQRSRSPNWIHVEPQQLLASPITE